jgi:selenocysteine-specific elongation factor
VAQVRLLGNRELAPGAEGWLQLRLDRPLALDKGDRFILRYPSPGQTIGGGIVLDAHPAHRWRRFKPEVLARFETLTRGSPDELILNLLGSRTALLRESLLAETGLEQATGEAALEGLLSRGAVFNLGDGWLTTRSRWEGLAGQFTQELATFHAAYPLKAGMPREALRSRLEIDSRLFNRLIALSSEQSILVDEGTALRLPDHQVHYSSQQQAAIARLRAMISAEPMSPPSVKEAEVIVGEDVLQALFEQGDLVQAGPEVLFDAQTYQRLVDQVRAFISDHGSVTIAQARDLFGTSRKYSLALLEHLDSLNITRRVGDERVLKEGAGR